MFLETLSLADELLAQYTRIEEAWRAAESKLAATRVPVDVRVKVGVKSRSSQSPVYLAYCRHRTGKRRICYVVVDHPLCEDYLNARPMDECNIEVRLQMFDHFAALHAEATAVARSYLPTIKERVAWFEQHLAAIE